MRNDVRTAVQDLPSIAQDLGMTMPQLAMAWVMSNPAVSSAIVDTSLPQPAGGDGQGIEIAPGLRRHVRRRHRSGRRRE
jgi:hypothetical protein